MNRIIHFEIQADEPEQVAKFYRSVFGWEITEWVLPGVEMKDENRYWMVMTGPGNESGINGGLVFRHGPRPPEGLSANAFFCTVGVADLDESVKKVINAGGRVVVSRMAILGVGWGVSCLDPEGNQFGMMQEDPDAG
ncbi:MAG: VOC family protein [Methanoregulaceae archaeon]|jgi:hypothetical protein